MQTVLKIIQRMSWVVECNNCDTYLREFGNVKTKRLIVDYVLRKRGAGRCGRNGYAKLNEELITALTNSGVNLHPHDRPSVWKDHIVVYVLVKQRHK